MTDNFSYKIIRSSRKTLALEIDREGQILVRAPQRVSNAQIKEFVEQKKEWILRTLDKINTRQTQCKHLPQYSSREKEILRQKAAEVLPRRCEHFARLMGVQYNRITIREQKTRWGSCSSRRNLNFNWKLILAPSEVLDYVVVHELSHLKEMNHSPAFWAEVEQVLPDYSSRREWLKECGWMLAEI